jgi:hypothetical protein
MDLLEELSVRKLVVELHYCACHNRPSMMISIAGISLEDVYMDLSMKQAAMVSRVKTINLFTTTRYRVQCAIYGVMLLCLFILENMNVLVDTQQSTQDTRSPISTLTSQKESMSVLINSPRDTITAVAVQMMMKEDCFPLRFGVALCLVLLTQTDES